MTNTQRSVIISVVLFGTLAHKYSYAEELENNTRASQQPASIGKYMTVMVFKSGASSQKSFQEISGITFISGTLDRPGFIDIKHKKDASGQQYICRIKEANARIHGYTLSSAHLMLTECAKTAGCVIMCIHQGNKDKIYEAIGFQVSANYE